MPEQASLERIAALLEKQIVLDLHFHGLNQDTIAKVLRKSKTWVNESLQGMPKSRNQERAPFRLRDVALANPAKL
jgi:hypothetical protein